MIERGGGRPDSSDVPTIQALLLAYRDRTGASYNDMSRKVGHALPVARLHQLATAPPKEFPKQARTMEALAELLEVPLATIVLAFAASLGMPVRETAPLLAMTLPPGTDDLTDRDRAAVLAVVRQLVDARRGAGAELVDLAHPPLPDLGRVAARKGTSEGKRRRRQQDDEAGT